MAKDDALPLGFTSDADAYEKWFRARTREAMEDNSPTLSHERVMEDATALLKRKSDAEGRAPIRV